MVKHGPAKGTDEAHQVMRGTAGPGGAWQLTVKVEMKDAREASVVMSPSAWVR